MNGYLCILCMLDGINFNVRNSGQPLLFSLPLMVTNKFSEPFDDVNFSLWLSFSSMNHQQHYILVLPSQFTILIIRFRKVFSMNYKKNENITYITGNGLQTTQPKNDFLKNCTCHSSEQCLARVLVERTSYWLPELSRDCAHTSRDSCINFLVQ